MQRHYTWTLATASAIVATADAGECLLAHVGISAAFAMACFFSTRGDEDREGPAGRQRSRRSLIIATAWLTVAASLRPSFAKLARIFASALVFPYYWLALVYADDVRYQ